MHVNLFFSASVCVLVLVFNAIITCVYNEQRTAARESGDHWIPAGSVHTATRATGHSGLSMKALFGGRREGCRKKNATRIIRHATARKQAARQPDRTCEAISSAQRRFRAVPIAPRVHKNRKPSRLLIHFHKRLRRRNRVVHTHIQYINHSRTKNEWCGKWWASGRKVGGMEEINKHTSSARERGVLRKTHAHTHTHRRTRIYINNQSATATTTATRHAFDKVRC